MDMASAAPQRHEHTLLSDGRPILAVSTGGPLRLSGQAKKSLDRGSDSHYRKDEGQKTNQVARAVAKSGIKWEEREEKEPFARYEWVKHDHPISKKGFSMKDTT